MPSATARLLAVFLCLLLSSALHAQVYKCVGANGKIGFSDKPCLTSEQSSTVKLRKSAPAPAPKKGADGVELAQGWTPGTVRDFTELCASTHLARAKPAIDAAAQSSGKRVDPVALRAQYAQACECAGQTITSRFSHPQYQADRDRIVNQVAGALIQSGQCPVALAATPPPGAAAEANAPPPKAPPPPDAPVVQHGDDSAEQSKD